MKSLSFNGAAIAALAQVLSVGASLAAPSAASAQSLTLTPSASDASLAADSAVATDRSASPLRPAESAPPAESAEERLDRVANTLRAVSAGRCQTPEMLTGLSLHDIGAYDAEQRALVESRLLLGTGVGVRHIVPESTAARAGLRPGDVITQVNGVDLASFETGLIGVRASYDRTASFERLLDAALVVGPATLTLRRGGSVQTMTLTGIPGCGGKPVLYDRGGLNAWSDGKAVAVTTAMMRFAKTDAELAFVVAHEMSHNVLGHADKLRGKSMLLASFGIGSGKIKRSEIEADQMAVELMIAAGYPVEGATSLLRRASPGIPLYFATTHPGNGRRMKIVKLAAAKYHQVVQAEQMAEPLALLANVTDLSRFAQSVGWPAALMAPPIMETLTL